MQLYGHLDVYMGAALMIAAQNWFCVSMKPTLIFVDFTNYL